MTCALRHGLSPPPTSRRALCRRRDQKEPPVEPPWDGVRCQKTGRGVAAGGIAGVGPVGDGVGAELGEGRRRDARHAAVTSGRESGDACLFWLSEFFGMRPLAALEAPFFPLWVGDGCRENTDSSAPGATAIDVLCFSD